MKSCSVLSISAFGSGGVVFEGGGHPCGGIGVSVFGCGEFLENRLSGTNAPLSAHRE